MLGRGTKRLSSHPIPNPSSQCGRRESVPFEKTAPVHCSLAPTKCVPIWVLLAFCILLVVFRYRVYLCISPQHRGAKTEIKNTVTGLTDILKTCASLNLSDYWSNGPQRNGLFPRNLMLGKGKIPARGVIVSKRNSQLVRPLQDVPEAQTTMGQWWSGDHTCTELLNHAYPLLSI